MDKGPPISYSLIDEQNMRHERNDRLLGYLRHPGDKYIWGKIREIPPSAKHEPLLVAAMYQLIDGRTEFVTLGLTEGAKEAVPAFLLSLSNVQLEDFLLLDADAPRITQFTREQQVQIRELAGKDDPYTFITFGKLDEKFTLAWLYYAPFVNSYQAIEHLKLGAQSYRIELN